QARVHRVLARPGGPRLGRDERQHLGGPRRHQGADPVSGATGRRLIRQHCGALVAVAMLAAGCADEPIINTGEPPAKPATTSPTPSTPTSNAPLVNAFNYAGHVGDITGYYFTTPSGKWRCAILAHTKAGCQAASNWQSGLGITGAPESVRDAAGQDTTPNAIVVDRDGDSQFVALKQPEFWLQPGPANS